MAPTVFAKQACKVVSTFSRLAALSLLVTACGGGGGVDGWVKFNLGDVASTTDSSLTTIGTAFVPPGGRCYPPGGILGPPLCYCDIGDTARLTWSNAANGASGIGQAQLPVANATACTASDVWWRIADVPLAMGVNVITVTLTDDSSSGSGKLTITRN